MWWYGSKRNLLYSSLKKKKKLKLANNDELKMKKGRDICQYNGLIATYEFFLSLTHLAVENKTSFSGSVLLLVCLLAVCSHFHGLPVGFRDVAYNTKS